MVTLFQILPPHNAQEQMAPNTLACNVNEVSTTLGEQSSGPAKRNRILGNVLEQPIVAQTTFVDRPDLGAAGSEPTFELACHLASVARVAGLRQTL